MTPHEAHAPELASALRPDGGHGASALVVGSTARHRRALLGDVTALLRAAAPRWLVVALPPRAHGARFDEALSAAVEAALHAAGAPEPLHDAAPGARTGSWLYRARSAGCEGLALVVDDLDAWLDGRAGASSRADVLALLATCRRAPVSVVAAVRAASAAPTPALPEDVASAFDRALALGGAPAVVTRDPSTLVPALAGRSFHLSGLRAAVEAWIDLPPPAPDRSPDDTAIVFTSPLAAPVLPAAPDLALDWEPQEEDPRTLVPAPPPPEVPVTADDVARWSTGLREAIALGSRLRRARAVTVADPASAERAFVELVADLPRSIASVTSVATSAGVDVANLRAAAAGAVERFDRAFGPVLDDVTAGRHTVRRVDDLAALLTAHAEAVGARSTALVLLPGLRRDLWGRFQKRVLAQVPGLRPAGEEGVAWSLPGDDAGEEATPEAALQPRREHRGSVEVVTVGAYAAALKGGVTEERLARVEALLPAALCAVAGGFAGRTAVLVAGERGVGEGAAGARSAFAVLVPWGLYTCDAPGVREP